MKHTEACTAVLPGCHRPAAGGNALDMPFPADASSWNGEGAPTGQKKERRFRCSEKSQRMRAPLSKTHGGPVCSSSVLLIP
eukprot:4851426-Amphidinium_carterae.1